MLRTTSEHQEIGSNKLRNKRFGIAGQCVIRDFEKFMGWSPFCIGANLLSPGVKRR
jgi:hypothetical protein